jgi:hypothetical protein
MSILEFEAGTLEMKDTWKKGGSLAYGRPRLGHLEPPSTKISSPDDGNMLIVGLNMTNCPW